MQTGTSYIIHRHTYDSMALINSLHRDRNREMARTFEPRGVSDIVVRPNGERVAEINSSRLEP